MAFGAKSGHEEDLDAFPVKMRAAIQQMEFNQGGTGWANGGVVAEVNDAGMVAIIGNGLNGIDADRGAHLAVGVEIGRREA